MKPEKLLLHLSGLRAGDDDYETLRRLASDLGAATASLDTRSSEFRDPLHAMMGDLRKAALSRTTDNAAAQAFWMMAATMYGVAREMAIVKVMCKMRRPCPEPDIATIGPKFGRRLAALDPDGARSVLAFGGELPPPAREVATRTLGSYSTQLRAEATQLARERLTVEPPVGHSAVTVAVAIALLPEPLYPHQFSALLQFADDAALEDARRQLLDGEQPFCTDDPDAIRKMIVGPVAPGVISLTAAGRQWLREYLRSNEGDRPGLLPRARLHH